jgi:hypothetical protein
MKKLIVSAILLGILGGPVFAQKKDQEPLEIIEQEKKQQAEALDKQYKRTMDRTRKESDTPRNDPWATMRAPSDGKR